jgi:hypothetical protein
VYRAARGRPEAIVIIDGFFSDVPAVWHKEILWALASGVAVYGASSMGALRAAELAEFGMVGIGEIFQGYRSGTLEDDDDVALVHAPAELDYVPLSEAMVNIRATLRAARSASVITTECADALERVAKATHYRHRTYAAICATAAQDGGASSELARFQAWLPTGKVDQKALDAIAVLERVAADLASGRVHEPPPFDFAYTAVFDELRRSAGALRGTAIADARVLTDDVLDEARLAADWDALSWQSLARVLALDEARRAGITVDEDALLDTIAHLRRTLGLQAGDDIERWIAANDLTGGDFIRLLEDETRILAIRQAARVATEHATLDVLRLVGRYPEFARRSRAKHELAQRTDFFPPSPEAYASALAAFVGDAMAPDDPRLARVASERGFRTVDAMIRAAYLEHALQREANDT